MTVPTSTPPAGTAPVRPSSPDIADVLRLLADARDAAAAMDLTACDASTLTEVVRAVERVEATLAAVRARAVSAAERTGVVARSGAASSGAWLARQTGAAHHDATAAQRLADAVAAAPDIAEAMTSGRVGTGHAKTLAAALHRGVLTEQDATDLIERASALPAGAFARETRMREAVRDQTRLRRREVTAHDRRRLDLRSLDDGSVEGSFRLAQLDGETLRTALGALEEPDPADTPEELRRTPTQRRADAFTRLLRTVLDRGDTPRVRTVRPHVTVTVPVTMLAADRGDAEAAGALGTTEHGTVLSAALTRQVLCDATVRRLVLDPDGRPLDVGRATRTWSGGQRAASAAVDGGCRGPACDRPFAWTDLHHIVWWRDDGGTGIDNALPLCSHCHDLVHGHGWTIELAASTRAATWTAPDGRTTTTYPRGPAVTRRPVEEARSTAGRRRSPHPGRPAPSTVAGRTDLPPTVARDTETPEARPTRYEEPQLC